MQVASATRRAHNDQTATYAGWAGAALVGLVIATATSFAQAWLNGSWQALANSASPFLLGAFVAGAIQVRRAVAITAGLGSCVLEVVAYYIVTSARGFAVSTSEILFWGVCAMVGGPVFGWAGWAWRRAPLPLRAVGAAFLPATFVAEAIGTYLLRLHYGADAVLFAVIGIVAFAVLTWRTHPARAVLATAGLTTAVLTVVGIALYWLGLDAAAGVAFGA